MRACVRCGLWQAAAADGKCALCVALRWRATRACCARVRVGCACASACAARAPPVCAVCCVLLCALFVQLGGAGLAGRAARRAAACCGWSRACLMVCGGRSARPTRSSAAQGAGMPMRAAYEAVCAAGAYVSVRRGTRVCVHAAGAGGRGGRRGLTAVRRPLVFCVTRVGAQRGLAAIALPRRKKNFSRRCQRICHLRRARGEGTLQGWPAVRGARLTSRLH